MSGPLADCPLKKRPPSRNLVFCFFVLRKDESKAAAVVEVVSLETVTRAPYLAVSLLSMPLRRVASDEAMGISRGVDCEA